MGRKSARYETGPTATIDVIEPPFTPTPSEVKDAESPQDLQKPQKRRTKSEKQPIGEQVPSGSFTRMQWNTTAELWNSYQALSVSLRRKGRRAPVNALLRAVIAEHFPSDPQSKQGLKVLTDYATQWQQYRGRARHASHMGALYLPAATKEALDIAQIELLAQGRKLPVAAVLSGLLRENIPSEAEAERLLDTPSARMP